MRDREHSPVINILKTFAKKNQLSTGDSALIAAMMIKCISLVIYLVEFCAHRHASVDGNGVINANSSKHSEVTERHCLPFLHNTLICK